MNDLVLRDLQRRLSALERSTVRYRAGEITGPAPRRRAGRLRDLLRRREVHDGRSDIGDIVATLVFGNDLIVLGRIV